MQELGGRFWQSLERVISSKKLVIDRPKGSRHPRARETGDEPRGAADALQGPSTPTMVARCKRPAPCGARRKACVRSVPARCRS